MIRPEIQHLAVPVDSVQPHPLNAREGDVETIVDSLLAHGQYRPVVARAETRDVIVGNHTYAAMLEAGADQIAVRFVDVSAEKAAQIVSIDNRASDLAKYDDGLLASILDGFEGDYSGTGFDDYAHAALLRRIEDAADWAGSRGEVPFALGRITFKVDADLYRSWAKPLEAHPEALTELRRRLEL